MARNRQRAKERQARRKAQGQSTDGRRTRPPTERPGTGPEPPVTGPPAEPESPELAREGGSPAQREARENGREEEPVVDAHLRANAPPEDVGRSDEVLEYEQDLDSGEAEEHFDLAEDEPEEDLTPERSGQRAAAERHKDRPRFVQFLFAVWAELKRVQWPKRQDLTTLTGVVLGFVLLAGGYLGLLDAIFSRIIQAIL
ncbi:MAG TPA: preprotein translocase subunit SecE [Thermoleophilaceae bacterium]|nr:preprotein translocase subunit SecE [Thermoleophilaceae bacterium]